MTPLARRILLIGWDAADWKLITPLLDAGEMPALEGLVARGVMGNLAAVGPLISPLLWTSIATGRRADAHGILGFVEPDPDRGGVRPVASTSRKVKALWNIFSQNGLRAHVVNWFASHPAEPIRGASVSNRFPKADVPPGHPWPIPAGAVHPPRLEDVLADLRVHPGDLSGAHLLPFVPGAAGIDQSLDHRLETLAGILAECLSVHAAATWIMEHEPWDFLAVYWDALDLVGHHFMPYHPPRMEGIPEGDFAMYQGVVAGMYRFHDMMLGRLLQLAGPETTVLLVSDHGFHSDHLRPQGSGGSRRAAPEDWHRRLGIIAMSGPAVRSDELIHSPTILDVTPTLLYLAGLPIGRDMEGRPLLEAVEDPPEPRYLPSWEEVLGESGMPPQDFREDPWEAQRAVDQLASLGYIDTPAADAQEAVRIARLDQTFNLALVHYEAGRPAEAAALFEQLVAEQPQEATYALFLAQCRGALGQLAESRRLTREVLDREPDRGAADLLMGHLALLEGRDGEALECLLRAEQKEDRWADLQCLIGAIHLRGARWADAERTFGRAAAADPDHARAHFGLSLAHLAQGRLEEAADEALTAVGLNYRSPEAHLVLGMALARIGRADRAIQAFRTCLTLQPGSDDARRWLAAMKAEAAPGPL